MIRALMIREGPWRRCLPGIDWNGKRLARISRLFRCRVSMTMLLLTLPEHTLGCANPLGKLS